MGRVKYTLIAVALTLVSCSSQVVPAATPTTDAASLRLFTTTSVLPLTNDLTVAYAQQAPDITFDIVSGNYAGVVGRVSGNNTPYLLTNHLPADSPLWAAPIGQDGIAVIVNPANPLTNLTTAQLRDIYQGRVANWQALGGLDEALIVVSREDGSGTRAEFEELVMGDRRTTRSAQVAPSSAAMLSAISTATGGIGYVSFSYLNATVRSVRVGGVAPTSANLIDNTYPLRSTIFVVGAREPTGDYRAFIGWVQSPAGQAVVARRYAPMVQR